MNVLNDKQASIELGQRVLHHFDDLEIMQPLFLLFHTRNVCHILGYIREVCTVHSRVNRELLGYLNIQKCT